MKKEASPARDINKATISGSKRPFDTRKLMPKQQPLLYNSYQLSSELNKLIGHTCGAVRATVARLHSFVHFQDEY